MTHCHRGQTQIIHIVFTRHNIHLYVHVPIRPAVPQIKCPVQALPAAVTPPCALREAGGGEETSDSCVFIRGRLLSRQLNPSLIPAASGFFDPQLAVQLAEALQFSSRLPLLVYQGSSSSKKKKPQYKVFWGKCGQS